MSSNLCIERFGESLNGVGERRPKLDHAMVMKIPGDSLDTDDLEKLSKSLEAEPNDDTACAASVALWEDLLEKYPSHSYIMLLVADARMTVGREVTAVNLYEELNKTIKDPKLSIWISQMETRLNAHAKTIHARYMSKEESGFAEDQLWTATAGVDPFPTENTSDARIQALKERWDKLSHLEEIMAKYLNAYSIETNAVEGTLDFDKSSATILMETGFLNQAMQLNKPDTDTGLTMDRAMSILSDTRGATEYIIKDIHPTRDFVLDTKFIVDLHAKILKSSRVLPFSKQIPIPGRENKKVLTGLSYTSLGMTRQRSEINVTAIAPQTTIKIQFCPCEQVDAELETFCHRFNKLISQVKDGKMDPFAAAAWISHVFITIHPFEDGNGRTCRLLASIPLIFRHLPPICITKSFREPYIDALNKIRGQRDGNYSALISILYTSTLASLDVLDDLE